MWWPLLVAAVLVVCAVALFRGYSQLAQMEQELVQIKATNQGLSEKNQALYQKVLRLRANPAAVENAVRQQMGMVRPDEVVYLTRGRLKESPSKEDKP